MQLGFTFADGNCNPAHAVNSRWMAKPFNSQLLKWIGNKQRVAQEIISFFPDRFGTYHEPFVGSGGVLGVLCPAKAEASDSFGPLVAIWIELKSRPENLKKWYSDLWHEFIMGPKVAAYEQIKQRYNLKKDPADLLFLARSCYGGVMRFRMRDGYMSTPCGTHDPIHPNAFAARVDEWHRRLRGADFFHREYEEAFDRARPGDVVYCDPPYSHSQAILYGAQKFDLDDLFRCIDCAKHRGVFIALSIDGTKKSGAKTCKIQIPTQLFAREVSVNVGRSMLRRFQMGGRTLESEVVMDRLLLSH